MSFAVKTIFIVLSIFFFGAWFANIYRRYALLKGKTKEIAAQLTFEKVEHNFRLRIWDEDRHIRTGATYAYEVDGVIYKKNCVVLDRNEPMPSVTKVVYHEKKPRRAYLPEFEGCCVKGLGTFLFIFGIMFLLVSLV